MFLIKPGFKLSLLWVLLVMATRAEAKPQITKKVSDRLGDGTQVKIYTLANSEIEAAITTYGGIVVSLRVPDRLARPPQMPMRQLISPLRSLLIQH